MANPVFGLEGKNVLLTGGAQGIGLGCARLFAEVGANVAIADLNGDKAEAAAGALRAVGVSALGLTADVRKEADIDVMVAASVAALGSIDILVNNAGGDFGYVNDRGSLSIFDVTREYFDDVIDLNLKQTFFVSQACVRHMLDRGQGGAIVNVSSFQGFRASPGLPIYGAAKAAIAHLTQTMAYELGPFGIRVNCVAPTYIESDRTKALPADRKQLAADAMPLRRTGEPRDLAAAVVFLASPLASYYTGHHIIADGGLSLTSARPPILWTERGRP